ncbi:MAG: CYTH domain-containing protein [Desulfobulbaceae bacterium]|nr:CYTH domain-containing protein [Desulfobulbaceae bacterium]
MGIEIERKFLVNDSSWKKSIQAVRCCQGYLCPGSGITVRVRVMAGKGYLTIKGKGAGIARREYEYAIPVVDAREMLERLCEKPLIEKNRYTFEHAGMIWEVDEFLGENSGLIVAEVELEREDQMFSLPAWVGREVTGDPKYFNAALVRNPYLRWKE